MVVSRGFLFFIVNLVVVFLYVNADVSHIGEFSDLLLISFYFLYYKFINNSGHGHILERVLLICLYLSLFFQFIKTMHFLHILCSVYTQAHLNFIGQ